MGWGFYGRADELRKIAQIIGRNRWFFAKITGRRRIGKTRLIQQAIRSVGDRPTFYVQIPDSGSAGVLSAIADAMETFGIPCERVSRPRSFSELARLIGALARSRYIAVLDEFQYFNKKHLQQFCSDLQAEVDTLSSDASRVPGGLIVLGSIYTEMSALLEDRSAPLHNRTTDDILLSHLDIASVVEILRAHATATSSHLLF